MEDGVLTSNGAEGIVVAKHSEQSMAIQISNVNASAHRSGSVLHISDVSNAKVAVHVCHFSDNERGVLLFEGDAADATVIVNGCNFTRNHGSSISVQNLLSGNVLVERSAFNSNSFNDYKKKEGVVSVDSKAQSGESSIVINDCFFELNSMHSIIRIVQHSESAVATSISRNDFRSNLAQSVLLLAAESVNATGNLFYNVGILTRMCIANQTSGYGTHPADAVVFAPFNQKPPISTTPESTLPDPFSENSSNGKIAASQIPYYIGEEVYVRKNETFVLEAGTILDFAAGVGVTVQEGGKLIMEGTEEKPVVLRGLDGNTWRGVVVKPNGTLDMTATVIEDASIGLWIDSQHVHVHGGSIVRPNVHGVEITHNSNEVVDLGWLTVEECSETAIGIDERRDDLLIQNAVIRNGAGGGIDFVSPTGNIEIRNVEVLNGGAHAVHVSEFPSAPLHAVLINNVTIGNQTRGQAGVLITGGWLQNVGIQKVTFVGNSVPSLIIALECNKVEEKMVRIENSTFEGNQDVVAHVEIGSCARLQMENNKFLNNNLDRIGSALVVTAEPSAEKSNEFITISRNEFVGNNGVYTATIDGSAQDAFFSDNSLTNNTNSGAVVKVVTSNVKLLTNKFNNPSSKYQLAAQGDSSGVISGIVDARSNDWGKENIDAVFESIDAPQGSVRINPLIWGNEANTDIPDTTVLPNIDGDNENQTVSGTTTASVLNSQCAHLNFCSRRGKCEDEICRCPAGFVGFDCSMPMICNCSSHGFCDIFNRCKCEDGWTSMDCAEPVCRGECNNHGRCMSPGVCECGPGWRGDQCDVSSCVDDSCLHGKCENAVCKCDDGWQGSRCQVPMCSNCSLNGVCVEPERCQCFKGYDGSDCSECVGDECDACDFDCDHGICDLLTRTCSCSKGWNGGACDVCMSSNCAYNSRILYILPSTAERDDTNAVVNVYGLEFPKSIGNEFVCTFGRTTVSGIRVSSSLIRCPIPANMTVGRHVFSVETPGSLDEGIGSPDKRPIHFTLYEGCVPTLCQGTCMGPLCMCPAGKSGVLCDRIEIIPTLDRRFLENQKLNEAIEGTPYILSFPTMFSSVLRLNSTIPDLEFVSWKGIIAWEDPVGSDEPYQITVNAYSPAGEASLSWNLTVKPSYSVEVTDVTVDNNKAIIKGRLVGNATKKEFPVLITVRNKNGAEQDEILAMSNADGEVQYEYVPAIPGSFDVTMSHPGRRESPNPSSGKTFEIAQLNQAISGKSFSNELSIVVNGVQHCEAKLLQPNAAQNDVVKGSGRLTLSYGIEWDSEVIARLKCDNNSVDIIRAPAIAKAAVSADPVVLTLYHEEAQTRIYTITLETRKAESTEISATPSTASVYVVGLDNSRLPTEMRFFFAVDSSMNPQNGSISFHDGSQNLVEVPFFFAPNISAYVNFKVCARDEWDGQDSSLASSEVVTISLTNLQKNVDVAKNNVRVNVQWADFMIPSGVYQLQVRSESHQPVNRIVNLSPLTAPFCVNLVSLKSTAVPTLHCQHFSTDECELSLSPIVENEGPLPWFQFEPSVVTSHNQKILATARGSVPGVIGMWNDNFDEFSVTHSRRTVAINESFWTTLDYALTSDECRVRVVAIPFVFVPEASDVLVHSSANILIQTGDATEPIYNENKERQMLARSTSVMCNCGDGARVECRLRYRPAVACGSAWSRISDDTVNLEVLTGFLLMLFECNDVSVNFDELRNALRCVASIENECPISRRKKRDNDVFTSMQKDSPVNIVNHLSAVNNRLGMAMSRVMPVLNALDVQTIRISTLFIEFIDRLENVFPRSLLQGLNRSSIDVFLESIGDLSEEGNAISAAESAKLEGKGLKLVKMWNSTVESWKSGRLDGLVDEPDSGVAYADVKQLVVASDRIKTIARQNLAVNPFVMLHDYMSTMLQTTENQQNECAKATVSIDEEDVEEGNQMRIRAFIQNSQNITLTNVGVTINFLKSKPSEPDVNFNVGPSWSAGIGSLSGLGTLVKGGSFEIHWTRSVSVPRRLTRIAKYQPIVILAFSVNGRQNQQKLFVSEVTVHPKRSVKAINIIKDEFSPKMEDDFSIMTAIINPGYSPLNSLRVNFDVLKIKNNKETLKLESTSVGETLLDSPTLSPFFDFLSSGSTALVKLVMRNKSATVTVSDVDLALEENGRLIPLESRGAYAIRAVVPTHNGMLLALPTQEKPLFFFRPTVGSMTNIIQLDYASKQEEKNSTAEKTTYYAAFRNPESTGFSGALWASMPMPEVPANRKLLEIIDRRSPRPRPVQPVTWVTTDGDGKEHLNWIDYGASLPAQVVTYELVFADPQTFDSAPVFDQSEYRIQIPPDGQLSVNSEVGQLSADGDDVTYSFYAPDNERRFVVDPENGKIYFDYDGPIDSEEYCMVLEAKDQHGKTSRVPVAINNGGPRRECVLFSTDGLTPMVHLPPALPTPPVVTIFPPVWTTSAYSTQSTTLETSPTHPYYTTSESTTTEQYTPETTTTEAETTTTSPEATTTTEVETTWQTTSAEPYTSTVSTTVDWTTSEWTTSAVPVDTTTEIIYTASSDATLQTITWTTTEATTTSTEAEATPEATTTEMMTETTTEFIYTMTPDRTLPTISISTSMAPTTSEYVEVLTSTVPLAVSTASSLPTDYPISPPIVIPTDGASATTSTIQITTSTIGPPSTSPLTIASVTPKTTLSPEQVEVDACRLVGSSPILKIVCDISRSAVPRRSM